MWIVTEHNLTFFALSNVPSLYNIHKFQLVMAWSHLAKISWSPPKDKQKQTCCVSLRLDLSPIYNIIEAFTTHNYTICKPNIFLQLNKKVLLHGRKRHTNRSVSSTPYSVLSWGMVGAGTLAAGGGGRYLGVLPPPWDLVVGRYLG